MLIEDRVKQLMKAQGMDIKNNLLVVDMTIIYLEAQRDQLRKDIESVK